MVSRQYLRTIALSACLMLFGLTGVVMMPAYAYEGPAQVTLSSGAMTVKLSVEDEGKVHIYTVNDARTGREWTARGAEDVGTILRLEQTSPTSLQLLFKHCQFENQFTCNVTINGTGTLSFEINAIDNAEPFAWLNYPPVFQANLQDGALVFCDRSCGVLLPQSDLEYPNKVLTCYGNIATLDMPWLGILDRTQTDGVMVLLETPCDVVLRLETDAQGRQWPRVIWRSALETFAYTRRVSYRFVAEGGYVALAKAYREYANTVGQIVPLEDRITTRPHVGWLRGAALIWGADGLNFARQAKTAGLRRAVIYGRISPDDINVLTQSGYLTAEYDSYTDILEGPRGFQRDSISGAAYRDAQGNALKGWQTLDGVQYFIRSSALARSAAESYLPETLEKFPFTARFIDVSSAIDLFEDYHPEHRFNRQADMEYRRELYKYFGDLGLVSGGEHAKAWVQPYVDYTEGTMSGPFWWESKVGHLITPQSREELPAAYWKYAADVRYRIPLYELVFHDCIVSTWYWGDSSDFLYQIAPEQSDNKDLLNILYGTVPLIWADNKGYGWDRNRDRFMQTYRNTCRLHEVVGFEELLSHEFLTSDGAVQHTSFASGAEAVVNFGNAPYTYEKDNRQFILAPKGFFAQAQDFQQSRLWQDGNAVTHIQAVDYLYVETPATNNIGPVIGKGSLEFFQVNPERWNLILAQGGKWQVDLTGIKNFPADKPFRLFVINENGQLLYPFPYKIVNEIFTLDGGQTRQMFTVLVDVLPETIINAPEAGLLTEGQQVTLTTGDSNLDLRYTQDGTEPDIASFLYTVPVDIEHRTVITARAFRGDTPVGSTITGAYQVQRKLLATGVVRGGEAPLRIDVPVDGATRLVMRVDEGGDGLDYDAANLGDPQLVRPDGTSVPLGDLKPLIAVQHGGDIPDLTARDVNISDQMFATGMRGSTRIHLEYELSGQYSRFQTWAGIDGWTKGKGSVGYTVIAIY